MNDSPFLSLCPQVKFNQALADHSMSDKPRLIDGIVLTKFDTIDDKVLFFSCSYLVLIMCCGIVDLVIAIRGLVVAVL